MSDPANPPKADAPDGERTAARYEVGQLLGRGGMACVYHARDRTNGREVALKQLLTRGPAPEHSAIAGSFEREFHTLAQLRHPHVIAVYDYGLLADGSPFYTMELLDGGDLLERAPMPWRDACRVVFDVCSSLALIHSRRLLHRDISPRNIRCTPSGQAKLIDFGTLAPISTGGAGVVGTPAFVAPETLHRLALDARTDLYSLGATLYFTLTGSVPYPARTFADVLAAWGSAVRPPSSFDPGIPAALDDLVLALINLEPSLRPQSAFEVMQRLAAIAGLSSKESEAVSRAYLVTPTLVGREAALDHFRERVMSSRSSRGAALLIEGQAGMGRSRLLDACALEAKTLGFMVLRATAHVASKPFSIAHDLTQHLLDALPLSARDTAGPELVTAADGGDVQLSDFSAGTRDPAQLQRAICRFWSSASHRQPILIAVDDSHSIDPASAAVLAMLLDGSHRGRTFILLSTDSAAPASPASSALSRRGTSLTLEPLSREQTRALFASLFGEVRNLDLLTQEIHRVAQGVPRQCLDVAQHLIDRGLVRYVAGHWTLPGAISAGDLPRSAADAMRSRIERLSPQARLLAEAQALAFTPDLRDSQYRALSPGVSSQIIERALAELLENGVLVQDGVHYTLQNRLWIETLTAELEPSVAAARHRALATMYKESSQTAFIYHGFACDLDEDALAALSARNAAYATKSVDHEQVLANNTGKMMTIFPRPYAVAQRLGKSARFVIELRRWHFAGLTTAHDSHYPIEASAWCQQLIHDAGLDLYQSDSDTSDAMQRLMRALQGAQERYLATPEHARVYTVEEAIKLLAEYVVLSIASGCRRHDNRLLSSLPPLLEPFIALAPVLNAIWSNAVATEQGIVHGQFERARERWLSVLSTLDGLDGKEMPYVDAIANAVAAGIGLMEAHLGLSIASSLTERLERDSYQRVSALQLRRIGRLEQGDSKGAERYRRQAEILSLQASGPQMFTSLLVVELAACAHACDLAGIQDVSERIRPLAAIFPGWVPNLLYGEACFHFVRGDYELAKRKCEESLALTAPDERGSSSNWLMWFAANVCLAESLLAMDMPRKAHELAKRALEVSEIEPGNRPSELIVRVLSLAEAKLGEPGGAARLEASIARLTALGVSGLRLGMAYEARAQIAIWQRDANAFERYAELTAREYRHGGGSPLGTRYDRLINEAERQGLRASAALSDFARSSMSPSSLLSARSSALESLASMRDRDERARAALQLICSSRNVRSGQLYLRTTTGLTLAAIQGDATRITETRVLSDFIARLTSYDDAMDEMETNAPVEAASPNARMCIEGTNYTLLLLSCLADGVPKVAGLAALAVTDDVGSDVLQDAPLLSALAAHLLAPDASA